LLSLGRSLHDTGVQIVCRAIMISIICCIDAVAAMVAVVSGMGERRQNRKYHACAWPCGARSSVAAETMSDGRKTHKVYSAPRLDAADGGRGRFGANKRLLFVNDHGHRGAQCFETSCPGDVPSLF
jgi:hypothetical protein